MEQSVARGGDRSVFGTTLALGAAGNSPDQYNGDEE